MISKALKARLEEEVLKRNSSLELSLEKPDPLMVAKCYNEEYSALICALFSYGNAKAIVNFLNSLDFSLLESDETAINRALENVYYRFQSSQDVITLFLVLSRWKQQGISLEERFLEGYSEHHHTMDGIRHLLELLYAENSYRTRGYQFLLGTIPSQRPTAPYKRWHMFLRWMVRKDALDLGLWERVRRKDLLMPLDTHTFRVGQQLGLIKRKSYDFLAVQELTEALKRLDPNEPIKYDFALYRLGQEKFL